MPFTIHADFPGGNVSVGLIDGHVVHLAPDLRDTPTPWFYWYFAVRGAGSRELEFVFSPENIGVRGPAVSEDQGRTWRWLGADAVFEGRFKFQFSEDTPEVRFSVGMPYVHADWDRFASTLEQGPSLQLGSLLPAAAGRRDVPLLRAGNLSDDAPFCVALTARHHCCEMMASYALEGLIDAVLAPVEIGEWLRKQVSFLIIPMMDAGGVDRGDQGKGRAPHDHNRDYKGVPIYPEVQAFKELLPAWANGRPLIGLDLHGPALSGPYHESIFFVEPECRTAAARLDALIASLCRIQQGPIRVVKPTKLPFGWGFNSTPFVESCTAAAWMSSLPGALLGVSLEIAYANANGSEVNADSARKLGWDLAAALKDWLTDLKI